MKINYQLETDKIIKSIPENSVPALLLHSCCAPCSSYVIEYLSNYFNITVYYYNPNIDTDAEYRKRAEEQIRLIESMEFKHKVDYVIEEYNSKEFYQSVKGLEKEPEGGARCIKCFTLRLKKTAEYAKENNFDYFTTTLTISPLKNSQLLNELGKQISEKYNLKYLFSDFKKKNGYLRSCQLADIYNLYRQNFCGCVFSKNKLDNDTKI